MVSSPARRQRVPPEQLRRRVDNLKSGSYIDDVIAAQDSALYRWPDNGFDAVRVYIEPTSSAESRSACARQEPPAISERSVCSTPLGSEVVPDVQ